MLSYEEFKEELKKQLFKFLPPEFAEAEIIPSIKEKDGIQKEGFYIQAQDDRNGISNNIFMLLKPIYTQLYIDTCDGDFEQTMHQVSLLYEEQVKQEQINQGTFSNVPFYLNIKDDKEGDFDILFNSNNVFFCVVNKKSNQEYMANIPHQDRGDISMYLRLLLSNDGEYLNSIIIDKNILHQIESKGINFSQLVSYAIKNTPQLFPAQVSKLDDDIYMVSNKSSLFGVATLFYPENPLQFITNTKDIPDNLIILPCSDFCIAYVQSTLTNEEYKQCNLAIRAYVKEHGGSALVAYPFVYDVQRKLITDKEDILNEQLEGKEENMGYRRKERSL